MFPNCFSCGVQALTGADTTTPLDSEDKSELRPDIEPDQNLSPRPDTPEIEDQERQRRQKASAQLQPFHCPTVNAKLCSTAFKKISTSENLC